MRNWPATSTPPVPPLAGGVPQRSGSTAQKIVEVVLQEFGQDNCSLFVVQEDSNELARLAVAGPYADQVRNVFLTLDGGGVLPRAIRTGETVNVPDVRAEPDHVPDWDAARSSWLSP